MICVAQPTHEPGALRRMFLPPATWHFGGGSRIITTLLGSCVSVVLWSPRRHIGGICHFLLPRKFTVESHDEARPEGYFGDEALRLLSRAVAAAGLAPSSFVAHIIGGGAQGEDGSQAHSLAIGRRNAEFALEETRRLGFARGSHDVGGQVYRRLSFNLHSGELEVHRGALA